MPVPRAGSAGPGVPARLHLAAAAATRRVRAHAAALLLAATAAGAAFGVASLVVGPENAVFAPVAAVVATGLSAGQRVRRAAEISLGVVLGILAADLLTRFWGVGPLQLALAVLLAMTGAVAVRPSQLMANQAAVAAVVVVALVPYLDAGPWVRLGDALVGGVVAVALNAVLSPDPYRAARAMTLGVLSRYADVVRRLAHALRTDSLDDAERALEDLEALDGARAEIRDAVAATRERVFLSRQGRAQRRESLKAVEGVVDRVVIMMATGRGLCRATANEVRHGPAGPAPAQQARSELAAALDELVLSVEQLHGWLNGEHDTDLARELALRAAVTASHQSLRSQATSTLVGQVRSAVIDVLRMTGYGQAAAVAELEAVAGRADEIGL